MKTYTISQEDRKWFTQSIANELCSKVHYGVKSNEVHKALLDGVEDDITMDAEVEFYWEAIDDYTFNIYGDIKNAHFFLNGEEIEIDDMKSIIKEAEANISEYTEWLYEPVESCIEPDYYEEYLIATRGDK